MKVKAPYFERPEETYKVGDGVELPPLFYDSEHTRYYLIANYRGTFHYLNLETGDPRNGGGMSMDELLSIVRPIRKFTRLELHP